MRRMGIVVSIEKDRGREESLLMIFKGLPGFSNQITFTSECKTTNNQQILAQLTEMIATKRLEIEKIEVLERFM